jgi:GntR family transcriptional regulator
MPRFKINKTPLHLQAQQHLLSLIEDGTYQPGEQLPSEVDLAAQLGISRPTLREALLHLEQKSVVIRKHGVGTFVANGCVHRLESGLERLESVLELADKLQVVPGISLTIVRRVIVVDRVPVAYMLDVAPASILSPADVDERFDGSVLNLLRQKQSIQVDQAVADIVAVDADAFLAKKLSIPLGRAVLLLEETLFDQAGEVVEFSRNYFVPDFFHFRVVRR